MQNLHEYMERMGKTLYRAAIFVAVPLIRIKQIIVNHPSVSAIIPRMESLDKQVIAGIRPMADMIDYERDTIDRKITNGGKA